MPEDELIAYLLAARRAGDKEASGLAVAMLIWGLMDNVQLSRGPEGPAGGRGRGGRERAAQRA